MNNLTAKQRRNSKLEVTLRQWREILNKELVISKDLRKQDMVDQAEKMIIKIKRMM